MGSMAKIGHNTAECPKCRPLGFRPCLFKVCRGCVEAAGSPEGGGG